MKNIILASSLLFALGCGSRPAVYEVPWFCDLVESEIDEMIVRVKDHPADHSAKMARAVLSKDDARACWGPAAVFLGARHEQKAFVLIDKRLIQLTAQSTTGRALTEVDPLLVGMALTAHRSDGAAERAVGRLAEMAVPKWWTIQDSTTYPSPQAALEAARVRAHSALYALAYTRSPKAIAVLQRLRDDAETRYQLGEDAHALLSSLIRKLKGAP